jgi:hypothetical protein
MKKNYLKYYEYVDTNKYNCSENSALLALVYWPSRTPRSEGVPRRKLGGRGGTGTPVKVIQLSPRTMYR